MVLIAFDIESSRLVKSLARFDRPWAVKKLIGLSMAEFTRLPVASLDCVFVMVAAVLCNCRRLARTPAVRTMSDMMIRLCGLVSHAGLTAVILLDRRKLSPLYGNAP